MSIAGFAFFDRLGEIPGAESSERDEELLADFLEPGPLPVLFTLGSSAVMEPGSFFDESIARVLGRKDYRARRVTRELNKLMTNTHRERAEMGAAVAREDGARTAADVVENLLKTLASA